jgi:hypothetical protein
MRILLSMIAVAAVAAPAFASSIEPVTAGMTTNRSVESISCSGCPPLKEKRMGTQYHVDPIDPGTQKVEIREVNGVKKIYRTEAWFGGSPVVVVTKATDEAIRAAEADTAPVGKEIDMAATSALDASAAADAVTASAADLKGTKALDASAFELRTD